MTTDSIRTEAGSPSAEHDWSYDLPLRGRRIAVLGAGTRPCADPDSPVGNGRAISVLSARAGAAVACIDLRADAAEETASLVGKAGAQAVALAADLSDPAVPAAVLADARSKLGGLDGIVVNVGIGAGYGLRGTTVDDWDQTMAVNLRAHFLAAKAALDLLPRGGSMVHVSSTAAFAPGSYFPAYDASKAGLTGLLRQTAWEASPRGIRVNTVVPGVIDTPLGRFAFESHGMDVADVPLPLGRPGTAWEVAAATVFLLSGQSSYVHGHQLVVDGGLTVVPGMPPFDGAEAAQ